MIKKDKLNIMIEKRTLQEAKYIIDRKTTVREVAKEFGVSKSCAHTDLSKRLKSISLNMYEEVNEILQNNKEEKSIRGGHATKEKYLQIKLKR